MWATSCGIHSTMDSNMNSNMGSSLDLFSGCYLMWHRLPGRSELAAHCHTVANGSLPGMPMTYQCYTLPLTADSIAPSSLINNSLRDEELDFGRQNSLSLAALNSGLRVS